MGWEKLNYMIENVKKLCYIEHRFIHIAIWFKYIWITVICIYCFSIKIIFNQELELPSTYYTQAMFKLTYSGMFLKILHRCHWSGKSFGVFMVGLILLSLHSWDHKRRYIVPLLQNLRIPLENTTRKLLSVAIQYINNTKPIQ